MARALGTGLVGGCLAASATPAMAAPAPAAPAVAEPLVAEGAPSPGSVVTVTGSGFGHGVGMSQYGAYGMALKGASAATILRHYFSGTTVQGYPDDLDLRVNVVDRGSQVTLRGVPLAAGGGALQLVPGGRRSIRLVSGDVAVVTPTGGGLRTTVTRSDGKASTFTSTVLGVRWSGARSMAGPATLLKVDSRSGNAASTSGKSRRYRWGSLSLSSVPLADSDGVVRPRIEANALLNLHREYLRGLAEVPTNWPRASLAAQVVAARNYALAQVGHTIAGCGGCNLWDDTRSQVYRGWDTESGAGGSRWVQAIAATQTSRSRGLVVLYHGKPITAYYSSSTGGRTRDAASVWGTAVPYLRSVDDRWSTQPRLNPRYASWKRSVPLSTVRSAFGLPDLVALTVTARDASGAVVTLSAKASDGTVHTLPGSVLRSRFGLPAQWVRSFALPPSSP